MITTITKDTKLSELYHSDDELAHFGIKGMKWGIRKDKYSDTGKNIKKFKKQMSSKNGNMAKRMLTKMTDNPKFYEDGLSFAKSADSSTLKYDTKNMSDKDRKLYTLNYYNDRKEAQNISIQNQKRALDTSKMSRSERELFSVFGGDYTSHIASKSIEACEQMKKYYTDQVNATLKEMGDVKLSKIRSYRHVGGAGGSISWLGEEYVYKK